MTGKESALRSALSRAEQEGQDGLARVYRQLLAGMVSKVPVLPKRAKPLIVLVVDHEGWCGERLSFNLADQLKQFYDFKIVRLGDSEHLTFDGHLYVYRNICWMNAVLLPEEIHKRVITLLESERVFQENYAHLFPLVSGVIPLNEDLARRVQAYDPRHVWKPIPNGIDTKSFTPAKKLPEEFTVGCAGNFFMDFYDDWKGFSRYIVPACKKAGVKLDWRSWRGGCQTPGMRSKQEPLEKMPDFYRGLSCFVLMSKAEGCSGVTFEAQAAGLPVISTRVGWHGEQEAGGITWVERPAVETPESIERAIDALSAEILKVKARGRKKPDMRTRAFTEQYSWDKLAPLWKEAFDFYLAKAKEE